MTPELDSFVFSDLMKRYHQAGLGSDEIRAAYKAVVDYVDGLIQAARPKWISVKEKLPTVDQDQSDNHPHLHEYLQSERILACFADEDMDGSRVFIGRFVSVLRNVTSSKHEQWFEGDSEGSFDFEDVTHWMPLPEAKEGEK